MFDDMTTLKGLLKAYADGDVLARRVLQDWLEDHSDPRLGDVRAEGVEWDKLAFRLSGYPAPRRRPRRGIFYSDNPEVNRVRWLIDCARVGSSVPPHIAEGVRRARLAWLNDLFPEADLLQE